MGKKIKIYVYGADLYGKVIVEYLKKNGANNIAFIDRRAHELNVVNGLKVYNINELEKKEIQESIAIIGISNVFEHYNIACILNRTGFRKIIYKDINEFSERSKDINQLYDNIFEDIKDGRWGENDLQFVPIFSFRQDINDYTEKPISNTVIVNIPIELIFGVNKVNEYEVLDKISNSANNEEILDKICDKSIFYFTLPKYIMKKFLGRCHKENWSLAKEIIYQAREMHQGESVSYNDFDLHLQSRYNVFQNMELLYDRKPDFFYENPCLPVWNEKGYFNLLDGNNRAAYLLEKGKYSIPCKISAQDYSEWFNKEKVNNVKECLKRVENYTEYPISHPLFFNQLSKQFPLIYKKLNFWCEWMYRNCIDPRQINILDIDCKDGFVSRHFYRMGATVYAVEEEENYRKLCIAVNDLLKSKYFVYDGLSEVMHMAFDIVFISCLTGQNYDKEEVDKIFSIKSKFLIVDIIEYKTKKPNEIFAKKYNVIDRMEIVYQGRNGISYILKKKEGEM